MYLCLLQAIRAKPELIEASWVVLLFILNFAQSSNVLWKYISPYPVSFKPTKVSTYVSIAAAWACLISSLELGMPPISLSVTDSLFLGFHLKDCKTM